MAYENIKIDTQDRVTTITLNRPEQRNALSPDLHREMDRALDELAVDEGTRVVVLTGEGKAFCAGQDLKKFFAETYDDPLKSKHITEIAMRWGRKLRLFPRPTIAQVNGYCFGAGLRIMGLCDFAIAAENAIFGLSEINFGIIPAGGASKVPIDLLSHRDALYLILTGDRIDGKEADRMRLINRAVPADQLSAAVRELTAKLLEKNPIALTVAKEVFWRDKYMDYDEAVDWELAKFQEMSKLEKGEWVKDGVSQFVRGEYKPGFAAYKREEK